MCDFLIDNNDATEKGLLQHLIDVCNIELELQSATEKKLQYKYIKNFKTIFKNVLYQKQLFITKHEKWLQNNFEVKLTKCEKKRRRLNTYFLSSSTSTKRRKLIKIEKKYSKLEIEEAFLHTLRTGRKKLANAISQLLRSEDDTDNEESGLCIVPYTAEEALIEDAKLTKYQYEHIRMQAARRNANIYPLYQNFSAAQKECYPKLIEITEKGASVDLQSLIEHN